MNECYKGGCYNEVAVYSEIISLMKKRMKYLDFGIIQEQVLNYLQLGIQFQLVSQTGGS